MTTARRVVLILVGAALLTVFVSRFVLIELLVRRAGVELIVAALEAVAIFGTGWLARIAAVALLTARGGDKAAGGRTRGGGCEPAVPTAFILGYPIFGTVCFLIGTVRISAATMLVPVLIGLGAAVIAIRVRLSPRPAFGHPVPAGEGSEVVDAAEDHGPQSPLPVGEGVRSAGDGHEASALFAFLAIVVVLACGAVVAQAPPVSLDEVAYHLAVPRAWAVEGRAIDLPLLSHSYFPLGIESADLPLFALLGSAAGTASHFLHLIAALAVAVLLWRRTRRWGGGGALATAAIVGTPALAVTTGWSLVEWPLVGIFVVAALAIEDDDDATLAATIAGGLLTKYTFVPFAIALVAVSRRWRPALIGGAAGSIFFIRNLLLAANPVAPFFSAHAPQVSGFRAADLAAYVFDGRFVDESLGASMLMLVPAAAGTLAWIAVAIAALLFFLAASSRILLPFVAVGALSGARHGFADGDGGTTLSRRLVEALLIVAIAVQLLLVVWFTARDDAFSLVAGRLSDDDYVAARRPSYPAIAWLNSTLPAQSRTLLIGLNETYWFDHPVRGGGNFDGPRLSAYLADPALRERLRRDGITHLALFAAGAPTSEPRKRAERETALSPEAERSLTTLLSTSATPAGAFNGVRLFALR